MKEKPQLWREGVAKRQKKKRFRCAALHYLGLAMTLPGLFYTLMGLFDVYFKFGLFRPGDSAPNWGTMAFGLALLCVGLGMFFLIEE